MHLTAFSVAEKVCRHACRCPTSVLSRAAFTPLKLTKNLTPTTDLVQRPVMKKLGCCSGNHTITAGLLRPGTILQNSLSAITLCKLQGLSALLTCQLGLQTSIVRSVYGLVLLQM